MKSFLSLADVSDPLALVQLSREYRRQPLKDHGKGRGKNLGLIFMNPSLRTRVSTARAAQNLGMEVITLDLGKDSWGLELRDDIPMDGPAGEHIREAAPVLGRYFDILGLRSFPELQDAALDYSEPVLKAFAEHCQVPLINLESASGHPLQSLADIVTIEEKKKVAKPKVVLSWAPHCKALPQAVANSFCQWALAFDYDLTVTHPPGLELDPRFTGSARICHDQNQALQDADFVYVKNWSQYKPNYGKRMLGYDDWMLNAEKLERSNQAKIMHCLPVRRNIVIAQEVLDGPRSLVIEQAENRLYAAQAVLSTLLDGEPS